MIRVMIADDEEGIRDALSSLLDDDEQISLVGAGRDADQAIAIAAQEKPDVALLDVRMPRGGGPRAAREIAQVSPGRSSSRSPPTRTWAISGRCFEPAREPIS